MGKMRILISCVVLVAMSFGLIEASKRFKPTIKSQTYSNVYDEMNDLHIDLKNNRSYRYGSENIPKKFYSYKKLECMIKVLDIKYREQEKFISFEVYPTLSTSRKAEMKDILSAILNLRFQLSDMLPKQDEKTCLIQKSPKNGIAAPENLLNVIKKIMPSQSTSSSY